MSGPVKSRRACGVREFPALWPLAALTLSPRWCYEVVQYWRHLLCLLPERAVDGVCQLLSNTADGLIAVDRQQRIVMWNRAATAIVGHRPEAVLGRHCFEVLCGRDAMGGAHCRRGCDLMAAARRSDLPRTCEISVNSPNRGTIWLSMSSVVVPRGRHGLRLLVHIFRDVTRWHEILDAAREMVKAVNGVGRPGSDVVTPRCGSRAGPPTLTRREREVLAHLANGASTGSIATSLFVSRRTVRNHIANILAKLGVHNRLEAVMRCLRDGVL